MSLAVVLLTTVIATGAPTILPVPELPTLPRRSAERQAPARQAAAPEAAACAPASLAPAADASPPPGAQRLDQLPPHRHFMTVLRKERGCEVAVVKQDGRRMVVPLGPQLGLQKLDRLSLMR